MSDDILFQNSDVCILKPDSTRGIIIFTSVSSRFGKNSKSVCEEGLFSYNELRKRHPEYKLPNRSGAHINASHNDLIFFRAPYTNDTTTFESSYGMTLEKMINKYSPTFATIRVDPEKTYVYSSEIRAIGKYTDLLQSRILMTDYLLKLKNMPKEYFKNGKDMYANIIKYEKKFKNAPKVKFPTFNNFEGFSSFSEVESNSKYPELKYFPIERNVEVVVKIPHIPPEWFVNCITIETSKGGKRKTIRKKYKHKTRKITHKI